MSRQPVPLFLVCVAALLLTGCPARIDSRNPEKRLQALAAITDQAELARIARQHPDLKVSNAAWARLSDQTLLQIALAAPGSDLTSRNLRSRALEHMTGQEQLIRLAQETPDAFIARGAILRITSQEALAAIALVHEDYTTRAEAVAKVTDPGLLARLAVEAKQAHVRQRVVERLDDQALLARLAAQDPDRHVRQLALSRLKDAAQLRDIAARSPLPEARGAAAVALARLSLQASEAARPEHGVSWQNMRDVSDPVLLARCALSKADFEVRRDAVRLISDPALLALIASEGDRVAALAALEQLADGDALAFLTGDLSDVVSRIARLKLALRDPRLTARHPRLRIEITRTDDQRDYETVTVSYRSSSPGNPIDAALGQMPADAQVTGTSKGKTVSVTGEGLRIELLDEYTPLARHAWKASFPDEINLGVGFPRMAPVSINAHVRSGDLFAKLLGRPEFTPDDLAQILRDSPFDELRLGATRNLTDQALLTRLATGQEAPDIRLAATERLQDQAVLAAIAGATGESASLREAAIARLTDQALLARLALPESGYQPTPVRLAAINRIDDPAVLIQLVGRERDAEVRLTAFDRIRDRAALERMASDQAKPELAEEARLRLNVLKWETPTEPK